MHAMQSGEARKDRRRCGVIMVKRSSALSDRYRTRWRAVAPACAICGGAINFELKWPDPQCFVVDHIVPIAKGGAHTFGNTQPAHAQCNSKKRARLIAPIIKRSGSVK